MEEDKPKYERKIEALVKGICISRKKKDKENFVPVSKENVSVILRYDSFLTDEQEDYRTKIKVLDILARFAVSVKNKPFKMINEQGVRNFLYPPNHKSYLHNTLQTYYTTIAAFYKWYLGDNEECPRFVRKVKIKKRRHVESRYIPNDMWAQEDILKMVRVLDHPRDKALITSLNDTGAAPHEILAIKIRDVLLKENYAEVMIPAKTKHGQRLVPLTYSFPYMRIWIENHPFKNNPDAPLWIVLKKPVAKQVTYHTLYNLCTKLKERLGALIQKPFNPYCWARHSRATDVIKNKRLKTEFQIKQAFGWSPDSRMLRRYQHLMGSEFMADFLQGNGISTQIDASTDALKPIPCHRCNRLNPADGKYCEQCNFALTHEAIEEERKKEKSRIEELEQRTTQLERKVLENRGKELRDFLLIKEPARLEMKDYLEFLKQNPNAVVEAFAAASKELTEIEKQL